MDDGVNKFLAAFTVGFTLNAFLAVAFNGCANGGGSLPPQSVQALQQAASLNLQAYQDIDSGGGGSVPRALERGAYCATSVVLTRLGASAPDGGIQCQP
jgi:hypothetical protein